MAVEFQKLLASLTLSPWWRKAVDGFSNPLLSGSYQRPLICYNADVDGFGASYFLYKILRSRAGEVSTRAIRSRAIWNYEYDFKWLPDFLLHAGADLIICVDIPVIQELQILNEVASRHTVVIYDHHVVPTRTQNLHKNIIFINSRDLGGKDDDHPASAFAGGIAIERNAVTASDLVVLAAGLRGDWALSNYPALVSTLESLYPGFVGSPSDWKTPLGSLTSSLNALFRANPGKQFHDLQDTLSSLLADYPLHKALSAFSEAFQLEDAAKTVQREVDMALNNLHQSSQEKTASGVLVDVLDSKTFNVGIVATVLAKRNVAPVVAIGFESGERVQFELRVSQNAKVDLTEVLRQQRTEFQPLTSGGHPMAAGALVWKRDIQKFADSLRNAFLNHQK